MTPISLQIKFKLLIIAHKALHDLSPVFLHLCLIQCSPLAHYTPVIPVIFHTKFLLSSESLHMPYLCLECWPPPHIHHLLFCKVGIFRSQVKSHVSTLSVSKEVLCCPFLQRPVASCPSHTL